ELSHEKAMKATTIAAFHDLAEARTGDLDFVAKHYVQDDEAQAVKDQFAGIKFGKDLKDLMDEYEERKTLEAKCAKDADSLEQLYQEWVLMWQGNKLAQKWFDSDFKDRIPGLRTKSAKKLAKEMKKSNPHEWWWSQFLKDDIPIDMEKLLGKR
ncbi:HD domain-containing protein, partial [Patescibacteria group bacterium]|nr:HD domain-containing protein [Patescibacteria group bacterium]MBU1970397.1 HD domain-containing protein [Patescibacteria group bacterium]